MRALFFSILFICFISQVSVAAEVKVSYLGKGKFSAFASGQSSQRKATILDIIADLENQCMQGCKYYLPSIRETVLVDQVSDQEFYTWTYVEDMLDSQFYSKIIVTDSSVSYSTPTAEELKRIAASGRKHRPVFKTREGEWRVTEKFSSDGKFTHSEIVLNLKVGSSRRLIKLFSKRVVKKMKKNIQLNYKLFH